MSYTVSGYKAVISSGDFSYLGQNALILGKFTVGASLLTLTYFIVNFRKKDHSKQNDPSPAVTI
jgi:putative membrane protein